jgi:hypothetical protein
MTDSELYDATCSGGLSEINPQLLQYWETNGLLGIEYVLLSPSSPSSPSSPFFSPPLPLIFIQKGGEWHQLTMSEMTMEMNITYSIKSVSRVNVSAGAWFEESALWRYGAKEERGEREGRGRGERSKENPK